MARPVEGSVERGFEPVAGALAQVMALQGGGGAAVAALRRGRPVVDLWAGTVGERSLVHTWSVVKPLAATAVLMLVHRGRLALDTPVVQLWPELRAARSGLVVADVLGHRAGLVSIPPPGTASSLLDWEASVRRMAAAVPDWPPGTAIGEHALTYGHLLGEVVRRVDGRRVGRFLREELAGPLGLDLFVGVPRSELARVADLDGVTRAWWESCRGAPGSLRWRALGPGVDGALVNGEGWRAGEVPAVNGHATARGVAAFHQAVSAGELARDAWKPAGSGPDLVLGNDTTWTLGSMQPEGDEIGMGGLGGSFAGTHRRLGVSWAFLTTVMGGFDRADLVADALYACSAG